MTFLFKKTSCIYFVITWNASDVSKLKTTWFAAIIFQLFRLFLRSGAAWNVWHRKKKWWSLFLFFFNKENANVCPSFHSYCMTDWFYIRWEKKTPPRRRKKNGNMADESNMVCCMLLTSVCRLHVWAGKGPRRSFSTNLLPHRRIAEVSNNTKGLFYLYTEQNK